MTDPSLTLPRGNGVQEPAGLKVDETMGVVCLDRVPQYFAPDGDPLSQDELIVLSAIKVSGGHISPSALRRKYRFVTAMVDADYDHGTAPTLTRGHKQRNLDPLGERATKKILRRQGPMEV